MNKCVIIANGSHEGIEAYKSYFLQADMIIAVDGGLNVLDRLDVKPHVILGDFDSTHNALLDKYRGDIPCITFPKRKDATDSELALDYAVKESPKHLYLFGMTGKRLDHGLTNIHMLKRIPKHIKASIIDAYNEIFYCDGDFTISGYKDQNLSIIPISDQVRGIKTEGLDYPLCDESLFFNASRGVSNVIKAENVHISVDSGEYFVIIAKD